MVNERETILSEDEVKCIAASFIEDNYDRAMGYAGRRPFYLQPKRNENSVVSTLWAVDFIDSERSGDNGYVDSNYVMIVLVDDITGNACFPCELEKDNMIDLKGDIKNP